jgi:hypothetical protein
MRALWFTSTRERLSSDEASTVARTDAYETEVAAREDGVDMISNAPLPTVKVT